MFGIFFLISFNYNALRSYKDSLVVTARDSGAEAIPFIKVWAILPAAILLTFLFTRLTNRYNREKVFYIMMTIFLVFFLIFTFVLFPAQEFLHPHETADKLQAILPEGLRGMVALFRNWTFTLFYVMSELWGTAILTVLFWGFANEITKVHEAKRYYGVLMIGANLAGILSGQVAIFFSGNVFLPSIPYGSSAWDQSMLFLNCTIIASGGATMALFRWLNKHAMAEHKVAEAKEKKIKMSMRENFAYLAKSKYLICIAVIVLAYNLGMNLIEVVWKNQIKQIYPSSLDYNIYMGQLMTLMGVIATLASIFVTGNIMRRFSWTTGALIPAAITLITGSAFFIFVMFQGSSLSMVIAGLFSSTPLMIGLTLGTLQNCLSRASKYTLFDATKEMAFIPLSSEGKLKGKAAIDGVGSRIGKSGSSVIHQCLLLVFATVGASTPYVAGIFFLVVIIWVTSVFSLGKKFDFLTKKKETLEIPEEPERKPVLINETA